MNSRIHTLMFNKPVSFINQSGARFYNATTKESAVLVHCFSELPAKLVSYFVEWTVPPQDGDHIEWLYDGSGTYRDGNHIPMNSQQLHMINCCDVNTSDEKDLATVGERFVDCPATLLDQIRWAKN